MNYQWHLEMHQAETSLMLWQSPTLHIGMCRPVNGGDAQHQEIHIYF